MLHEIFTFDPVILSVSPPCLEIVDLRLVSTIVVSKEDTQRDKKHSLPGPQPPNSGPQHCHAAVSEPLLAVCSHQILQNFRRRFAPPNFWDLRTVTLHGNLRFWDLRTVTLFIPLPQSEEGALDCNCCAVDDTVGLRAGWNGTGQSRMLTICRVCLCTA